MSDYKPLSDREIIKRMAIELIEERFGEAATPQRVALLTAHLISFEKQLNKSKDAASGDARPASLKRLIPYFSRYCAK